MPRKKLLPKKFAKTIEEAPRPVKSYTLLWCGIVALAAFLAFLDATYITTQHYQNLIPPCTVQGCEVVLTSKYAMVGPIPLAMIGSAYFLGMGIFALLTWETNSKRMANLLVFGSSLGVLASIGFFLLQALVIKAFCQYCIFTEIMAVVMLIFSLIALSSISRKEKIS